MQESSDTMLITYAKQYIRNGFVVMPIINTLVDGKTQKKPIIKEWQKLTLQDTERILRGFMQPGVNGIGLLTGAVNGVFVLDVDPGADMSGKSIEPTPTVKTGRGLHYYFKYETGLGNSVNGETNFDTRGDGGFVVVPPSWHHLGEYEWLVELEQDLLAPIPAWVREMVGTSKTSFKRYTFGTGEGGRNQSAAKILGHVLYHLHEDLWEDFAWHGIRKWNKRNAPPLDEEELYKVFISIATREKLRRDGYKK
jgi:hypothetical protein